MIHSIYTIGHSTHSIEKLIHLLSSQFVSTIVDVRSTPYSRYNPQFNRESLISKLNRAGISYVFMGSELGARTEDISCYVDGKVQYSLLAQSGPFQKGLSQITERAKGQKIALMCAESDPLTCHRSILICRRLADYGMEIKHILSNGQVESHEEALSRLLLELNLGEADLFKTRNQLIEEAYEKRGQQIAFVSREKESPSQEWPAR